MNIFHTPYIRLIAIMTLCIYIYINKYCIVKRLCWLDVDIGIQQSKYYISCYVVIIKSEQRRRLDTRYLVDWIHKYIQYQEVALWDYRIGCILQIIGRQISRSFGKTRNKSMYYIYIYIYVYVYRFVCKSSVMILGLPIDALSSIISHSSLVILFSIDVSWSTIAINNVGCTQRNIAFE